MGKNNKHKKFLKSEKAKVKLKGNKRLLAKGQNITDTSFKVKKIAIQSQLVQQAESEAVTKKKLNLKDLTTRCGHHNTTMRVDAVNGLIELATTHKDTLLQNLCTFVSKGAGLCIDKEAAVRKEAIKLLSFILSSVDSTQLEPFLSELVSYLTVGMSHLYREIQEDSLLMLDAILEAAPSLVARASPKLLPAFLDQISIRKNMIAPVRTLSVNLQSANTSTRWRIKVLGRLHALLMASSELAPKSADESGSKCVRLVNHKELCVPIRPYEWDKPCVVQGIFSSGSVLDAQQDMFSGPEHMKNYMNVLMPLLFETWVEVGPSLKQQKESGNLVSDEAAELLECILEIMQLVYKYMDTTCKDDSLVRWFRNSFRDSFTKHILAHFPYLQKDGSGSSRNIRQKGQAAFEEDRVKRCSDQNLAVCLMACIFCEKPSQEQAQLISDHVMKCLESNRNINERLVEVLEVILIERSSHWEFIGVRIEPLVTSVVSACLRQKPDLSASPLFSLLCDLSVRSVVKNKNCQGVDLIYEKFIQQLPMILSKVEVTSKAMKTITTLVSTLHIGILISLRTHLTLILANLPNIQVEGMSHQEARLRVIYLLYSASVWRVDILDAVGRQLVASTENKDLLIYFIELLEYWRDTHPESVVAVKLDSMPWLMAQNVRTAA